MLQKIKKAAEFLAPQIEGRVKTAIVLGSGLDSLAAQIKVEKQWSYAGIPGFPVSTVEGHAGKLLLGTIGSTPVVAMRGRFHYYEGYGMAETTFPIRVFGALGVDTLYVSNAAGGTNTEFNAGDIMVITDHINFMPENPLRGKNLPCGPRFPDMSEAYDRKLISRAGEAAAKLGINLRHGVYLANQGPAYETPAEYNMYRIFGADAVGMSTVPEVIVARHQGMKVFGVSVITNVPSAANGATTHDEVQRAAKAAGQRLSELLREMIDGKD